MSQFAWVLYIFGAFLIVTGIKMLVVGDKPLRHRRQPRRCASCGAHLRVTTELHGSASSCAGRRRRTGGRCSAATPLFLALVLINIADLVFAVDSVPAIFAITTDTFIVYTSNIFAILGLRALYFALAAIVHRFRYLKYALALVLVVHRRQDLLEPDRSARSTR